MTRQYRGERRKSQIHKQSAEAPPDKDGYSVGFCVCTLVTLSNPLVGHVLKE